MKHFKSLKLIAFGILSFAGCSEITAAPGAKSFLERSSHYSPVQREQAIYQHFLASDEQLKSTSFTKVYIEDKNHTLLIEVTKDYLRLGNRNDWVRMPMSLDTALRVAELCNCILPTTKIVDAIYAQATARIYPQCLEPSSKMVTNAYFLEHHELIEAQLLDSDIGLLAGHKKDVVLTKRLLHQGNRVAIYGWQRPRDGSVIQPLSTWHGRDYVDYSHGIRLIKNEAILDGKKVELKEVLKDPKLTHLISYEGNFDITPIQQMAKIRYQSASSR